MGALGCHHDDKRMMMMTGDSRPFVTQVESFVSLFLRLSKRTGTGTGGCAEWIHVFFMLYDGTEGLLADFCRSKYMNPLRTS